MTKNDDKKPHPHEEKAKAHQGKEHLHDEKAHIAPALHDSDVHGELGHDKGKESHSHAEAPEQAQGKAENTHTDTSPGAQGSIIGSSGRRVAGGDAPGGEEHLELVTQLAPAGEDKLLESYSIFDGPLEARVAIRKGTEHIKSYIISIPHLEAGTSVFIDDIKTQLLKKVIISSQEVLNIRMAEGLKVKFFETGKSMVRESMPELPEHTLDAMAQRMVQDMLGLGEIDYLLHDNEIEEICVNGGHQMVWIFHKKHGWLRTNVLMESDMQIWNYASSISRGVGRQINTQSPLLDAYLSSGDRVNATLFPISYFGNTITIRKFARKPWTITDFIKTRTLSLDVAALMWLVTQYEMNVIVSGGTGAGKTSLLNVLSMFIPPNQRVISIEQTREINLPSYMQWVPLVVREKTSEGTGGVDMLDLMVNTLRMRPDRMIVGEIRRAEEAQVLFEAMHTGHSVYATLHAETVSETVKRLTNPPISIPSVMMESLHLVIAMFRDRKNGFRRVFEVGEIIPTDREGVEDSVIYRWRPYNDEIVAAEPSVRLMDNLKTYTNMRDDDIAADLAGKKLVLEWLLKNDINTVEGVGQVMSSYYDDPVPVLKAAGKK